MRIDGLVPLLNVADVGSSIAFYAEALGFEVENTFENEGRIVWARVSRDGVTLMLNEHGEQSAARRTRQRYRDVVLYVSVDSADDFHAHLAAKGLSPGDLHDEEYGIREFALRDPDGYELGITSPIPGPSA